VIDTDVSTSVAAGSALKPDLVPVSVRVKTSRYADSHTYQVQIVREPMLLPALIMSVLTNAIDTEGNLPDELTAHLSATIRLKDQEPITLSDTFSGPRYTGPMGASALFSPLASIVNIMVRNSMAPVRIEAIDCDVQIEPGRKVAADRIGTAPFGYAPGRVTSSGAVRALKPHGGRDAGGLAADPGRLPGRAVRGGLLRLRQQRSTGVPQ
jgi:hypothetical protein